MGNRADSHERQFQKRAVRAACTYGRDVWEKAHVDDGQAISIYQAMTQAALAIIQAACLVMSDRRPGGNLKKASKRLARTSSQNANQNLKVTSLYELYFAHFDRIH